MEIRVYFSYWTPNAQGDHFIQGFSAFCKHNNLQLQIGDEIDLAALEGDDQFSIKELGLSTPRIFKVTKRSISIVDATLYVYMKDKATI